jgi:type VI secretion system protein ImpE
MAIAQQALSAGDLDQALSDLQQQVRKDPANSKHRIFLFQLQAVLGQWAKALNQLNVLAEMDAATLPMTQTYREALQCEVLRAEVFAGRRTPLIFGDPPTWLALLLEALRLAAQGQMAQSQTLREQALAEAPAIPGRINDEPFVWLADADARLGPVLEIIVNGRYYWAPLQHIRHVELEAPVDLRDLVWTPAQFTWANGGGAVGLIPTRYPGSETAADHAIRMARKTEWLDCGGELYCGLGQRMLATDAGEYPLLEVRSIALTPAESA